ncbi:MAG: hypothetical protein HYZ22_19800 [Chloroflexi bacterium]|nr:hypothetical protein [Chloroflexota bacterium]
MTPKTSLSRRDFIKTAAAFIGSPCHDGHFDAVGNVLSGPPPRPLDEFVTKIENGNLYVSLPPIKRKG